MMQMFQEIIPWYLSCVFLKKKIWISRIPTHLIDSLIQIENRIVKEWQLWGRAIFRVRRPLSWGSRTAGLTHKPCENPNRIGQPWYYVRQRLRTGDPTSSGSLNDIGPELSRSKVQNSPQIQIIFWWRYSLFNVPADIK